MHRRLGHLNLILVRKIVLNIRYGVQLQLKHLVVIIQMLHRCHKPIKQHCITAQRVNINYVRSYQIPVKKDTPKINLVTVPFFNSLIFLCSIVPIALIFYFFGYFRDLLIVSITKPCRFESLLKHIVSKLRYRLLFLIMHHRNILSARFVISVYNLKNKVPHVRGTFKLVLKLPPTAPIRG